MTNDDINLNNFERKLKIDNESLKDLEDKANKISTSNSGRIENIGNNNKEENQKLEEQNGANDIQNLHQSITSLKVVIESFKTNIEKFIDYQSRKDEEIKGKDAISRGEVKTKKYTNYYDRNFTIPRAQAANPNDYDSSAYNNDSTDPAVGISVGTVKIYRELERYADTIYVTNDGSDTLFAIISHGGSTNLSKEEPIYPGEVKCFYWVYEMRFRSPTSGLPYRVSEYCLNKINTGTTAGGVFTAIEKGVIHNTALPAANTDFFATVLSPTNTPTLFRIMAAISVAGNLNVTITRGGNTQTLTLNTIPGPALNADGLYILDVLVHSGDTINLQYSVTGGTIRVVRVQEIDASVT